MFLTALKAAARLPDIVCRDIVMAADHAEPRTIVDHRLEMTLRDTLENLEELALMAGYSASLCGMEIIAVIAADEYDAALAPALPAENDNVVAHPTAEPSGED